MVSLQSDGKAIFKVFIGAIIALAIITIIGSAIVGQTTISSIAINVTAPEVNATLDLEGRTLVSATSVANAANASNSSVGLILQTATSITTGLRTVQLTLNDTAAEFAGTLVTTTYTAEPDGYLNNSGARAISLLILIFAALAIMIFVVVVFIKDGTLGRLMGRS